MSMRGAFLGWSEEYGGYGNEEAAFEAGWNAALQLAETSNSSHNSESKSAAQIFSEMDKRFSDLKKFGSKYSSMVLVPLSTTSVGTPPSVCSATRKLR